LLILAVTQKSISQATLSDQQAYVFERLSQTPVTPFPFSHIYIDSILPEAFYQKLLLMLPDNQVYEPMSDRCTSNRYAQKARRRLTLNSKSLLNRLDPEQKDFWLSVIDLFCDMPFIERVFDKFSLFLQRYHQKMPKVAPRLELFRDTTSYQIGPHTDSPDKVFTFLFYLPQDRSLSHLGTSVYVPKDPTFSCQKGIHYPFERFDRHSTILYNPNTLFGFMKSDQSFHGREPITDPDVQRDMMVLTLFKASA
jgi:hypothetical protein